jgi:hypothetical protein
VRQHWQIPAGGVAAVALVALAVTALPSSPSAPAGATPSTSPTGSTAPPEPVILRHCYVPTPSGGLSLSADEAKRLTTVAARHGGDRQGDRRLRDAVEGTLEVTDTQAETVTRSLLGDRSTARLTCSYSRFAVQPEKQGASGLTPRAQRLRAAWTDVFGPLVAGGFAPGGVSSGHVDSSSHYDGRAMDVFFRPLGDDEQRRRGRVFAQWLVAHAQDYSVLSVIYADQIWTSWAASSGWREYVHPSGDTRNPVLRHLDHVHVAVEGGESSWDG